MTCGIYKITNKINGKVYIGCSKDIEHRWIAHKSESVLEHNKQYNYSIHKAFRKYGLDNFSFEIIEELPESEIFNKEKEWISFYDSYNNGYNETSGGDSGPSLPGETNPNSKLTETDVYLIRQRLLKGEMASNVFEDYKLKISRRGFDHVWRGTSWPTVLPEAIEYVKSDKYMSSVKSFAGRSAHSQERLKIQKEIRDKKEKGFNRLEVYKDYQNIYTLSGFNKVWYKK